MTDTITPRDPTPAETARTEAETAKMLAEATAATALARKTAAEAQTAELASELSIFQLAKAREDEAARTNSDEHARCYQFTGAVESGSVDKCMAKLRLWDRLDPTCPIEVIINSPGGAVIAGMALFDLLVRLSTRGGGGHHVTVGAQGYAASMGGVLLQAGDTRWIGAQSYLMIHEISAGTGGKIGEIKDEVKFYDAICERIVKIFVERSGGKITRAAFIKGWLRTDWWLMSDEALKLGFVDEVR